MEEKDKDNIDQAITATVTTVPTYPTGDTVPFPYERPYPQQVALMDALLQSLQQRQNNSHNHTGALFLLESPTGTGKSLSLAAASLAWLTYQEQIDLTPIPVVQQPQPAASSTNNNKTDDWITNWESPEIREARDTSNRIRQQARKARQALAVALGHIRQRQSTIVGSTGGGVNISQDHNMHSILERRKRVLQQILLTQHYSSSTSSHRRRKPVLATSSSTPITQDDPWALEEYYASSDDDNDNAENNSYKRRRDTGIVLSYESDNDQGTTQNNNTKWQQSKTRIIHSHTTKNSPIQWLQGAMLDGSASVTATLPTACTAAFSTNTNTTPNTVGGVIPGTGVRKIVYAARTHSQLSQFVREVRRIPGLGATVRCIALGGRKALCGNNTLRHKTERDLNDACLDLQKGGGSTTTKTTGVVTKRKSDKNNSNKIGCPLLASRENVATLALHMLTEPTDIEAAAALGEASHTCAYYASRTSLAAAQVVVMPYSMLLSQKARQAVGLTLHGSLVLVDEAHNLPEALRAIHATPLSLTIVEAALGQLSLYIPKYQDRLAGRNLVLLGQLRKTLLTLQKHLQKASRAADNEWTHMLSVEEFLYQLRLQNINFFKLMRYLEVSRLSQKLLGFMQVQEPGDENHIMEGRGVGAAAARDYLSKHVSAMSLVEAFLSKLVGTNDEGKIVLDKGSSERSPSFRYVLLDPANFLAPILAEAHAVALVGGTLRPFAHVASELLVDPDLRALAAQADQTISTQYARKDMDNASYTQINERFTAFSCGHVVSSDRVFLRCLSRGPTGQEFDLRHATRSHPNTMDELGRALKRIVQVVPKGGIVVFVGSYSYEAALVKRWKSQGLWEDLQKDVPVFREPTKSRDVDRTLTDYSSSAACNGALLLSVIGGKMSEGINFADDMARCVIIVGLPYPDMTDPVLKEKMAALDRSSSVGITGKAYYRNLCMRAVNQSVRAHFCISRLLFQL
jgi:chromosome transmission fidelity protein 1